MINHLLYWIVFNLGMTVWVCGTAVWVKESAKFLKKDSGPKITYMFAGSISACVGSVLVILSGILK